MFWLVVLIALMIPLVAVILDSQLGRALAARLERDAGGTREALNARVAALESELERLGRDMERLQEESQFMSRLLQGRAREALPQGRGEPGG